MKIFFARHGESQANLLHEISNRGLKHPLTPKGRQQALQLAQALRGRSIVRIYSSPVLRALETTITVAKQLGVEYEVTEALREYDLGDLEGRADEKTWELWHEVVEAWTKHRNWDKRASGGENFHEVRERFVPFLEGLIRQYRDTEANLLCIGHGGLYRVMLPLVLENLDRDFISKHPALDYASIIISELRSDRLICLEWNGIQVSS